MAVVTLKINNIEVAAEQGKSILATAKEAGIQIPTLCHLEGVTDVGACRLCMVEVKGSNKLLAACITQVSEGMEIQTHTDQLNIAVFK